MSAEAAGRGVGRNEKKTKMCSADTQGSQPVRSGLGLVPKTGCEVFGVSSVERLSTRLS